jgi:butyrate kinase
MKEQLILVINPRKILTRIAVYENYNILFLKDINHTDQELGRFSHYLEEVEFRKNEILNQLAENDICIDCIHTIIGRGGLLKPVKSGIYKINDNIIEDLKSAEYGEDVVNLGGILVSELAKSQKEANAYIVDPSSVDEYDIFARYTGHPQFERKSVFHTLNQKAMAKKHAKAIMNDYNEMNLIVVHLGSGISVGAHKKGRVVDANQVLDGDGPFSPERTGSLPIGDIVRYCFNSGKSENQVLDMIMNKGGLYAYLGTYSALEVHNRVMDGDEKAAEVFEAMAYQVAKEIGAMFAVLESKIDGIIITGNIANSRWFIEKITKRVEGMGPVHIYPGVSELDTMAQYALMAFRNEIEILNYS